MFGNSFCNTPNSQPIFQRERERKRKNGKARSAFYDKLVDECARFSRQSAHHDRLTGVCACMYVCVVSCPTVISRPVQPLTFTSECFCLWSLAVSPNSVSSDTDPICAAERPRLAFSVSRVDWGITEWVTQGIIDSLRLGVSSPVWLNVKDMQLSLVMKAQWRVGFCSFSLSWNLPLTGIDAVCFHTFLLLLWIGVNSPLLSSPSSLSYHPPLSVRHWNVFVCASSLQHHQKQRIHKHQGSAACLNPFLPSSQTTLPLPQVVLTTKPLWVEVI